MKSKAGKRAAAVAGAAHAVASTAAARTRGSSTPLSNTGVNSGVSRGETVGDRLPLPRERTGKFAAMGLANDLDMRQYVARVVDALDVLVPVLEGLVVGAHKSKDHKAGQGLASALVGLSAMRAAVTGAAENEGISFPVAHHVAEVVRDVLQVAGAAAQGAARLQLAERAANVSRAKGRGGVQ